MKYVVKNERGEWLSYNYDCRAWEWTSNRHARNDWSVRMLAFDARKDFGHGGKVCRIRKVTARQEREAILAFIDRAAMACGADVRRSLALISHRISSGEHRRRHAER